MSEPMHYSKAPITEATIDLRATLPDDVTMAQLEELKQALRERFPESQKVYTGELFFQIGEEPRGEGRQRHMGFRLISPEKRRIVVISMEGFTYSLLPPYDRWEPFRDEARGVWDIYRAAVRPIRVTRLAVRYINRLDIPHAPVKLKDYLRAFPEIPPELPQAPSSYFMQLVIPKEDISATAIINQAIVPPEKPETTSLILDIDLFREKDIPDEDDAIWNLFEQLRNGKNEIFTACLTSEAKGMIR